MLLVTSCVAEMHVRGCRVRAQRKCVRDALARLVACTGTSNTLGCVFIAFFAASVSHALATEGWFMRETMHRIYARKERGAYTVRGNDGEPLDANDTSGAGAGLMSMVEGIHSSIV